MEQGLRELQLAALLREIFGDMVWDDSAEETAARVMRYWLEYQPDVMDFKFTKFPSEVNQLIAVNNIQFASMCAHHLLPFFGTAHVGYIPNEWAVGLSKIPRVVHHFAHRPQMQEKMTRSIASFLKRELKAMGVAVILSARHTCMACRGIREHNGHMVTAEMRGVFLTSPPARAEFLELTKQQI